MKLKGRSTGETVKREISAWERSQMCVCNAAFFSPNDSVFDLQVKRLQCFNLACFAVNQARQN